MVARYESLRLVLGSEGPARAAEFTAEGYKWANLAHRERELSDGRAAFERELITALVGTPKPGQDGAPKPQLHSVSSAEDAIKTDPRWLDYRKNMRDVVLEKDLAWVAMVGKYLHANHIAATLGSLQMVGLEDLAETHANAGAPNHG